jgi:type I restriction enzyme S subunit
MSLRRIDELFNFEKGILQSSKCVHGDFDFITASSDWKTHNEYTHDCEALIFAAAASGSLGRTHYVNGKFVSSDLCFIITPKDQNNLPVDLKFYHILFNELKDEIVRNTKAGTSKEAIGLGSFGKYQLPYFDIEAQIEIKNKFVNSEDIKSSLTAELIHQLSLVKKLRQQLLQDAVQGKLVEQNATDEPASELLKKIKAEKQKLIAEKKLKKEKELPPIKPEEIPFEIPDNWVWCRLGEICNYGSSPKAEPKSINNETWVLDLEDIEKETSNLLCKIRFNERNSLSTKSKFKQGEVLYSKLRPYLDKVIVADEDGVCTTEILPLKLYGDLNPFYIRFTLKRVDFLKYVNSVTKGMKMPRLGTTEGQIALIPLPPLEEQIHIVQKLNELMQYCNDLEASIKQSEIQNEKLLQQVLSEALRKEPVEA